MRVDAIWGKPVPDWLDGSMQAELAVLLEKSGFEESKEALPTHSRLGEGDVQESHEVEVVSCT